MLPDVQARQGLLDGVVLLPATLPRCGWAVCCNLNSEAETDGTLGAPQIDLVLPTCDFALDTSQLHLHAVMLGVWV
jgi:hypothetical protein